MKKSSRLLPPIVTIILVIVVTGILVALFPSLYEESLKNDRGAFISEKVISTIQPIGVIGRLVFATGGFISLLISVKWLIETIFAIKSKD